MSTHDTSRRAVTVLLVVACLLTVAGVAQARFSGTRSGSVSVGTATMVAPSGVTGRFKCHAGLFNERVTFTVDGFADAGPAGATYRYTILKNSSTSPVATETNASRSHTIESPNTGSDVGETTWTLTITSALKSWTSPVWRKSITCAFWGNGSGSL
ncbi:MAG: hypothetical protein L0H93_19630 [Nocardioides sp.]|nr:hypothetical protein [Nocardioides sp.]